MVFDPAGNLVRSWGGPGDGYEWPQSNHGIHVDYKGNVWIGGNGEKDAQILKFTKDGKFLMQVGGSGKNAGSNNAENFGRVAKIWVDPKTNEAYLADGYLNKRVAVLDADTGKMKRYWGAYGNKPDDADLGPYDPKAPPAQQFRNPVHCVERANDGLIYVCDRVNNRIQIFNPDGTFVKEAFYAKNTLASGSTWDIAFSRDPEQRYIFIADGQNEKVRIILRSRSRSWRLRRRRPAAGPVLRRPQHRHGLQGQPVHDRHLRGQTRAEVRVQGRRRRAARRPGRALAEELAPRRSNPAAAPPEPGLLAFPEAARTKKTVPGSWTGLVGPALRKAQCTWRGFCGTASRKEIRNAPEAEDIDQQSQDAP